VPCGFSEVGVGVRLGKGDRIQRTLIKEVATMKRLMIGLLAVLFLSGACATVPVKPIASSDLPDLKGKWEGTRELVLGFLRTFTFTQMEIFSDTLPVKGKVIIYVQGDIGTDPRTYTFDDGEIDQLGNLIIRLPEENLMKLSYYSEERKKTLYGNWSHKAQLGKIVLHKK
jgi:hypothetical protein